jgi:uncharacterized protein (TIGR02996 family)
MSDVAEDLVLVDLPREKLQMFLDALRDDPEDELTLRAFTDWLEEMGDGRAELIRANLAMDHYCVQGWVKRYGRRWWGELPQDCFINVELKGASSIHVKPGSLALDLPTSLLQQGENALPATLWRVLDEGWVFQLRLGGVVEATAFHSLSRLLGNIRRLAWKRFNGNTLMIPEQAQQLRELVLENFVAPLGPALRRLANLPRLRLLAITHDLTDEDLLEVSRLPFLEEFDLMGCSQLSNSALGYLANLSRLRRLSLWDACDEEGAPVAARITDEGIAHLARLSRLEHLELSCPQMTPAGLNRLVTLTSLRSVKLWEFAQGDEGFTCLDGWRNLESLELRSVHLREDDLARLGKCSRLQHLTLHGCRLEGDHGLQHLAGLGNLQTLSFRYSTGLTDAGIAHLAPLRSVKHLDLSSCAGVTGPALSNLSGQLETLTLNSCEDLQRLNLSGLEHLRWIDCTNCRSLTSIRLTRLPALESLHTRECPALTTLDLSDLPALRTLNLSQCSALLERACAAVAPSRRGLLGFLPGLRHWSRPPVPAEEKRTIFSGVPGLTALDLTWCASPTDDGLALLAPLQNLQTLSLKACWNLTDAGVRRLAELSRLRSLDLLGCWRLTDACLETLARLAELRELNLPADSSITNDAILELSRRLPRCIIRARTWRNHDS